MTSSCTQCDGVGFLILKQGEATVAKRCPVCRPGSLFNPVRKSSKKKRRRKVTISNAQKNAIRQEYTRFCTACGGGLKADETVMHNRCIPTSNKRPSLEAMKRIAKPLVAAGHDWQAVQWEVLNSFAGLTNSDEDGEYIMDAIRECEEETEMSQRQPR